MWGTTALEEARDSQACYMKQRQADGKTTNGQATVSRQTVPPARKLRLAPACLRRVAYLASCAGVVVCRTGASSSNSPTGDEAWDCTDAGAGGEAEGCEQQLGGR